MGKLKFVILFARNIDDTPKIRWARRRAVMRSSSRKCVNELLKTWSDAVDCINYYRSHRKYYVVIVIPPSRTGDNYARNAIVVSRTAIIIRRHVCLKTIGIIVMYNVCMTYVYWVSQHGLTNATTILSF